MSPPSIATAKELTAMDYLKFVDKELRVVLGLRDSTPARVYLAKAVAALEKSDSPALKDELKVMLKDLREVHRVNCERFRTKYGRRAEISDQLTKHAEEIGEFIKAVNGKNDEPPLNELWDCIFSMLATALNAEGRTWTDDEILRAYYITMAKIKMRTGIDSAAAEKQETEAT